MKTNSLDFKRKTLRAAKLPEKQNVKEREKKAMFYEAAWRLDTWQGVRKPRVSGKVC